MFYCGGYVLEQQLQTLKHSYAHNHAYTSEVRALSTPPLNIEGAMRPAQKKGGVVHVECLATNCWSVSHSNIIPNTASKSGHLNMTGCPIWKKNEQEEHSKILFLLIYWFLFAYI